MKKIFLIISVILFLGCTRSNKNITVFFNSSHSFYLEKFHFKAELNNKIIIDTILNNTHIDKSVIIKNFNLYIDKDNILLVKINDKIKSIKIPNNVQDCMDIFTFYDDHTVINNIALDIENEKINKGIVNNYKQIVDSLKKTLKDGLYDRIDVNIKPKKCEN